MNKEQMETARLSFDLHRKNLLLTLSQKDVVVGKKGMSAQKCSASRNDFSYIRAMTEVKIGNLLKRSNRRISSKQLKEATKKVIENTSVKDATLSA